MSRHQSGQGTELAIVARLANFYFADPISYSSKNLEVLGEKFHEDIRDNIDPRFRNRVCLYVAAVFADICERAEAGDVRVMRGYFTNQLGIKSIHHWNYDTRSGLYIDAMLADPVTFTELPPAYKITSAKLTSREALGIELNTLAVCSFL